MEKRNQGRDEAIVEPTLPIIDTHHHLFDRPAGRYMFDEYLADVSAGHNVVASVYVETQSMARPDGPEWMRALGEVEFANGLAAMSASGRYGPCRVAAAIVGYADLSLGDRVAEFLDAAMAVAPDRFRGVRQITMSHPSEAAYRFLTHRPAKGIMERPGFRPGFRHLAPRNLTFDAAIFHTQIPELCELADAHPDTTIVLNHIGLAMTMEMDGAQRDEVFREWRRNLRELARRPNVTCKVGGLGTAYWGFGFNTRTEPAGSQELATAWKPFVETGIEMFGAGRCMMESDFPADGRSCGFVPLWNALKLTVQGCSDSERAALFHGTAARVYRIPMAAPA